jgi:hypothetical protein
LLVLLHLLLLLLLLCALLLFGCRGQFVLECRQRIRTTAGPRGTGAVR